MNFSIYENNCENIVGLAHLPIGLAGPLHLNNEEYFMPIATSEACLVASVNRGAKIIRLSGGAKITSELIGISRAPVFRIKNPDSRDIKKWIEIFDELSEEISQSVSAKSAHLQYLRTEIRLEKDLLFTKFFFDPKEAMGMNMASLAARDIAELLSQKKLGLEIISLSSNFCSDKKPSKLVSLEGRGRRVKASVLIPEEIIQNVLRISAEKFIESAKIKLEIGSELAQSIAANAHHANMIAGIFAATGQDLAHVVEGSQGRTNVSQKKNAVLIEVELPSLLCGRIGGGTGLPSAIKAFEMIGLKAPFGEGESSKEFAHVIAGTVLAGEISLLGALAENSLAEAHEARRKKPLSLANVSANLNENAIGIISYGSHVPEKRLANPPEFAKSLGIEKRAVPSQHDNTFTLGLRAAFAALESGEISGEKIKAEKIGALFLGTETPLYAVKATSMLLAEALNLRKDAQIVDMEFACKGGLVAMDLMHSYLASGKTDLGMIVAADVAKAMEPDPLAYSAGAGAAAFILSNSTQNIAVFEGVASYNEEKEDFWRNHGEDFPQHAGRFSAETYLHHCEAALHLFLKKYGTKIKDYRHIVFHMPNGKLPLVLAKKIGASQAQITSGFTVTEIGNAYTASIMLGFCKVLDSLQKNEKVLLLGYGSGAGAQCISFKGTKND